MSPSLLPDRILTASSCIVDLVPDDWSIAWTNVESARRQERAARFGLAGAALAEFTAWATDAINTGDLAWPSVFPSLEVARRMRARFLPKAEGLVLFGIALPRDLVGAFVDETSPAAGHGEHGVRVALRRGEAPDPCGRALGFDILGWDCGTFHSYVCNGLENDFASKLGVRPNQHGFVDRLDDARRCADFCNLETTGAEPGPWLPWLTLVYDDCP